MSQVSSNGIRLDVEVGGHEGDPPIVLIRGVASQRVRWPKQLLEGLVASRLRVVTFDNRDTGRSTYFEDRPTPSSSQFNSDLQSGRPVAPVYSLDDMALDVVGLLDALAIDRAHVLGHSIGGLIAQIVAARHPQRVRSLISLMSSPFAPQLEKMPPALAALIVRGPQGTDEESQARYSVEAARLSSSEKYPIDEEELRAAMRLERQRGIAPRGSIRQLMATMAARDLRAVCAQIRVPTLILHGTDDPVSPFAEAQLMATLIPGSVLKPLPEAGHETAPGLIPTLVSEIGSFCQRA